MRVPTDRTLVFCTGLVCFHGRPLREAFASKKDPLSLLLTLHTSSPHLPPITLPANRCTSMSHRADESDNTSEMSHAEGDGKRFATR